MSESPIKLVFDSGEVFNDLKFTSKNYETEREPLKICFILQ